MKTIELSGAALDYAVALAEGCITSGAAWITSIGTIGCNGDNRDYRVENRADDIIDREGITTVRCDDEYGTDAEGYCNNVRIPVWSATMGQHSAEEIFGPQSDSWGRAYLIDKDDEVRGITRREAAMRAWVLYKLGPEVDIPGELA